MRSGWSFSLLNEEQTRWLLSTNQFIYNVFTQDDVSLLHVLFIAVLQWSWPVARRSNFDVTESELESLGAPRSERPRSFTGSLDVSRTTRWYFKRFFVVVFCPYFRKMDPFWLRFFNASGLKPSSRKNFCIISRMAILVSICCILRVVFCNKVLFTRRSPKIFDEGTGKGCCSPDMLRI